MSSLFLFALRDDEGLDGPYHYTPTQYVAFIFIALYGISSATHLFQGVYYRLWWTIPTIVLCGLLEVIGWSGRLWSSYNPTSISPFQMQITATILAPTPLLAAEFVILGAIIKELGPAYSRLSPKWYSILFCSFDVISLVIQGVGGGMASAAANQPDGNPDIGGNVMLGGIVFQMVTMVAYVICATEFFLRYHYDRPLKGRISQSSNDSTNESVEKPVYFRGAPTRRMKIMIFALVFTTICLFIRAVYRTIELADGWSGRIITTELYFNVLDGTMIVLAIWTFNFAHPGLLLPNRRHSHPDAEKRNVNLTSNSSSTVA